MKPVILSPDFYLDEDVLAISQALLGKFIVSQVGNQRTVGMIVETEAYRGPEDKASHAYNGRHTARTKTMYLPGGVAYVYLCYGLHHLLNVVTAPANTPHAVLIRAIEPIEGLPLMLKRRNLMHAHARLTAGPGALTQALGITRQLDAIPLTGSLLWIEERGIKVSKKEILVTPRIGIDYAQEHRDLPWRFCLKNSPWTSKRR